MEQRESEDESASHGQEWKAILGIARDGRVTAVDGTVVELRAESICCHGDTPGAVGIARAVRDALAHAGIGVAAA